MIRKVRSHGVPDSSGLSSSSHSTAFHCLFRNSELDIPASTQFLYHEDIGTSLFVVHHHQLHNGTLTVIIFILMVNATDVFATMFALDNYEQTVVMGGVWWLDFNPFGLQKA
jgi:hypothetical protein